jgi:hypothetical protein
MWHAVTAVTESYDPILYESPESGDVLILNAGPEKIVAQSWSQYEGGDRDPAVKLEMRPGEQRIIGGALIRVRCGGFSAVGWRVLAREA